LQIPTELPWQASLCVAQSSKAINRKTWPDGGQNNQRHRRKECNMIGVFVKFHYGESFEEKAIRNLAETARVKFEAMPGLHSKAFTFSSAKREATNFYIWDSEDAAKAFFTDQLLERVAGLYGVRPSVDFVQIATLVENTPVTQT